MSLVMVLHYNFLCFGLYPSSVECCFKCLKNHNVSKNGTGIAWYTQYNRVGVSPFLPEDGGKSILQNVIFKTF
jgi:hypothetical protein